MGIHILNVYSYQDSSVYSDILMFPTMSLSEMFLLRGDIWPKDVHGQKLTMVQLKAVHSEQGR